jgi:hypothetical protein
LYCQLLTGSAAFNESTVKTACCTDSPWYRQTVSDWTTGWYGPGAEYVEADTNTGFDSKYGAGQYETPINVGASLTYHHNFNLTYPHLQNVLESGWPTPAIIVPNGL